jgi:hypothetical protein
LATATRWASPFVCEEAENGGLQGDHVLGVQGP